MKKILFIMLFVLALIFTGCARDAAGTQDAPHDGLNGADNSRAHIINMPNGFMNLAFKCNGTDGIYAHTRNAAPVIIPDDRNCKQASG